MRRIMFSIIAIFAGAVAFAQNDESRVNYVEVTGYAEQYVVPDEIYVQIVLNENDSKGKQTVQSMEKEMFAVLKKCDVDIDKNLWVMDMNSDYRSFLLKKNSVMLSKQYKVKLGSAQQMARVFQGLDAVGISNVNVISTDYSKTDSLMAELRKQAIQNAKEKAKELAQAIGQKIGIAIRITDNNTSARPFYDNGVPGMLMLAKSRATAEDTMNAPDVSFEKKQFTYRVTARFIL